jgi:peroxiredoxin
MWKWLNFQPIKGKNVVLYFYPKDDTPGCTIEVINFGDLKCEKYGVWQEKVMA